MPSCPSPLGLSQRAATDKTTLAFGKLDLKNHLDKDQGYPSATDRFQTFSNAYGRRDISDATLLHYRPAWKAHQSRRWARQKAREQARRAGKQRQKFESAKQRAELYKSVVMMMTGILWEQRLAVRRLRKYWRTLSLDIIHPSPEDIAACGGGDDKVSKTRDRLSALLMQLKSDIKYTNRIRNYTIRAIRRIERHIQSHA
ncbi:hypothetical protein MBM_01960 [Drepanopeziza brunnea f. sp. 'multigermtubi' MB_m1]|uniref:Uncharacterized protein n=1 Tax=Marssonina brunnea f. sp. multigermtubi (strain MB_m1) TaxID=1072389 RepID=K1XGU2_MARBU|nr:uncharacterized protein MBM_01960 [Drepanopeziza brunnea f. sp. 'multigermtubi' MB_m1]EKD20008.1 hypothetical protein MBM_01960 [Drepanopeziza brunnea f. sp. 'multigermtubi' MB_m1]